MCPWKYTLAVTCSNFSDVGWDPANGTGFPTVLALMMFYMDHSIVPHWFLMDDHLYS